MRIILIATFSFALTFGYPSGHIVDGKAFLEVHKHYSNPEGPVCYKPLMSEMKKKCRRPNESIFFFLVIKLRDCDMTNLDLKRSATCSNVKDVTECLEQLNKGDLIELTSYVTDVYHICNHIQFHLLLKTAYVCLSLIRTLLLESIRKTQSVESLKMKLQNDTLNLFHDMLSFQSTEENIESMNILNRLADSSVINAELTEELIVIIQQQNSYKNENRLTRQRLLNYAGFALSMIATYWVALDTFAISRYVLFIIWSVDFAIGLAVDAFGKSGFFPKQV